MTLTIVGAGLAGSEAAWQAAQRGVDVTLLDMRPTVQTGAHRGGDCAELVCSNSLGSKLPDRATGLLVAELELYDSLLLQLGRAHAVPAGGALAVDRDAFAAAVTGAIEAHPRIHLRRQEVTCMPAGPCVMATGPLTSPALSAALAALTGAEHLFFFDAIAPVVAGDSIDLSIAYRASRWDRGDTQEGDYINCPFDRPAYEAFVDALITASRIPLRSFEKDLESGVTAGARHLFEGCLPIEILASRGRDALAFGPFRPVGLRDPRTGQRPHAVLQLRREDMHGERWNLVGCQTNLRQGEQRRVFGMVPGLAQARFERYGEMHRNTFLNAPRLLWPTLQMRSRPDLFVAGQLAGVEGYMGSIGAGWMAGVNAARLLRGAPPVTPPASTMLGALLRGITSADPATFQPIKANFGLLPMPEGGEHGGKRDRARLRVERALADASQWRSSASP